ASRFLTVDGRFLNARIDLNERGTLANVFAGAHVDSRDPTLDLGVNCSGAARFECRQILGGIRDVDKLSDLRFHGHCRKGRGLGGMLLHTASKRSRTKE